MNLNDFSISKPRPLPVFLLADTSASMSGEKIDTLNTALSEMKTALTAAAGPRGNIEIGLIGFGGEEALLLVKPAAIGSVTMPELDAAGKTPMGAAFDLACTLIQDENIVSRRAYNPTLILVSDGLPTDLPEDLRQKAKEKRATREDFLRWPSLQNLHSAERLAGCMRLAVGVGENACFPMLHAFVNTPGTPVIRAADASGIDKFLQWVTLSIASRSVSVRPNEPFLAALSGFDDYEIVI